MPPSDAKEICERLTAILPHVKAGTLRFWGQWFGRPMDNCHQVVRCEAAGDTLRLWFDQGEMLTVHCPVGFEVSSHAFWINNASCVRWDWFYYGRPQTAANRYFEEFTRTADGISATTNVDWSEPHLHPSAWEKAVEVL